MGNIESAVNDLEAAVNDGLLDSGEGKDFMNQAASVGSQLALDAIDAAIAQGGDPGEIADAQNYLAEGNAELTGEAYKDAVGKYKDALAKAESALS